MRAACLLSGYKFLIDNMRQACELAYVGLVKLLIVAYCYWQEPLGSSGTATQLQLLLLLVATGTAHNSSSGCGSSVSAITCVNVCRC